MQRAVGLRKKLNGLDFSFWCNPTNIENSREKKENEKWRRPYFTSLHSFCIHPFSQTQSSIHTLFVHSSTSSPLQTTLGPFFTWNQYSTPLLHNTSYSSACRQPPIVLIPVSSLKPDNSAKPSYLTFDRVR